MALNLAVVTALWAAEGGPSGLVGGVGSAMVSMSRLAGLWASALLLVQVLGMARVPAIERAFGLDRVTAWHRWSGLTSFWLMVVHLVLIWWGYSVLDGSSLVVEAWNVTVTMPGMLLAFVGTAMIAMVGVTSFRLARRRLRYESWHLLHLYGYLGAGLALPHQLWTGTSFTARPWAAAYWWTLWGLTAVAVLMYRVAAPLLRNMRQRLRVASVVPDGEGLVTIRMVGDRLQALRVEAGQFFVFRFATGPGWTRGHPLSLSAVPSTAGLQVTMDVAGDDGPRIAAMRPGTRVLVEGPYGHTSTSARRAPHILGIAAGAGVAPVVALLEDNSATGGDILLYRCANDAAATLTRQTDALVRRAGLRYFALPGPRSRVGTSWLPGEYGHVPGPQLLLDVTGGRLDDYDVFVCGPPAWTSQVVADARTAGVLSERLHVETYAW
jgi:predicted ferric reductase